MQLVGAQQGSGWSRIKGERAEFNNELRNLDRIALRRSWTTECYSCGWTGFGGIVGRYGGSAMIKVSALVPHGRYCMYV